MFCEKCGKKLNDGEKFCEKCGAPVLESAQSKDPVSNKTVTNTESQPTPAKKPSTPLSAKTKKRILFSSIGVGVATIVLIIIFAVIVPMLNKVNVSDYISISFDENVLYEGHASASVSIDSAKISENYLSDKKSSQQEFDSVSNLDELGSYLSDHYSGMGENDSLNTIISKCDVSAKVKGQKSPDASESDAPESGIRTIHTVDSVENLKSDDVIEVTLTWSKDEESLEAIKRAEKALGISFDTTDKTIEIKVADELKKDDLKLGKPNDIDILSYIESNDLTGTAGIKDGELSFYIDDFTYEAGDYTLSYTRGDYFTDFIYVNDSNDQNLGNIQIIATETSYLSDGAGVELSIEDCHVDGTNIFIVGAVKQFTVHRNEPLNVETAKTNVDCIQDAFNELSSDPEGIFDSWKNVSISEIYLLAKNDEYANYENEVVVVFKGSYDSFFSVQEKYSACTFTDCYIDGDKLAYSDVDLQTNRDSLKEVKEDDYDLNDSDYKKSKIL